MMQVPAVKKLRALPEKVHTPVVVDVSVGTRDWEEDTMGV
jgi:hypothetical protein